MSEPTQSERSRSAPTRSDRITSVVLRLAPSAALSGWLGRLSDLHPPGWLLRAVIALYVRLFAVDLTDAVVPDAGWTSFNEFFTRALLPGARPFHPEPAVLCPADGRLADQGPIDASTRLWIKGSEYDVASLLGGTDPGIDGYRGGSFVVIYLSPRDYHRVHVPTAGAVQRVRHVPGGLFPVNDFGVRHVPRLFARNERVAVEFDSPVGNYALVMVGAMVVGRIVLTVPAPPRPQGRPKSRMRQLDFPREARPSLERGAELGAFELGSTVVLLFPPGFVATCATDSTVRMGQQLGRFVG